LQQLLPWGSRPAAALPRGWAEALADGAGSLASCSLRPARQRLAANLLQTTGERPGTAHLRGAYRTYARYYLALMRLAHQPPRLALGPYRWAGDAALAASVGRGRGTLVLSAHIGMWDLVGVALAERWGDVCIYAERLGTDGLFEFYRRVRGRHGVRVVPVGAPSREPHAVLARNGVVAYAADRPFGRRLSRVALGSGDLEVPVGGITLALRRGAGIHAVFAVRRQGEFVLECGPDWTAGAARRGDEAAQARFVSECFATALAATVRRHPDQWCQLHRLASDAGSAA
jgi:KDO2-lipid IV(A) lauroyltransferase